MSPPSLNMAAALAVMPKTSIRVFRPLAGARVDGFWMDPGQMEPIQGVTAIVQPSTPEEMALIAGGESIDAAVTIYTTHQLLVADDVKGRQADEVLYQDERWKLIQETDWSGQGFRKFIAGRTPTC